MAAALREGSMRAQGRLVLALAAFALTGSPIYAQRGAPPAQPLSAPLPPLAPNPRLDAFKKEAVADVESRRVFTQQLVDSLFSYSELGFQEVETERHLTDALVREGFDVQRSYAGIPTAWVAKFKPGLRKFYYDPTKYKSYLEQLGVAYPPPMPAAPATPPQ
jgi:hypothetical protein